MNTRLTSLSADDTASIAELITLRHAAPTKGIDAKAVQADVNDHLLRIGAGVRALGALLRDTDSTDPLLVQDVGFLLGTLGDITTELCMLSEEIRP